jgi:ferredoxin-thioredoxin reductase catalytic subunit
MDRRQGQAYGAKRHGQPKCPDSNALPIETRIMMAHGWRTGHELCDCPIMIGAENINITTVVGK